MTTSIQALLERAHAAERAHLEAVHAASRHRERARGFKEVLRQIADEDYRGPMPYPQQLAKRALADDDAAGEL